MNKLKMSTFLIIILPVVVMVIPVLLQFSFAKSFYRSKKMGIFVLFSIFCVVLEIYMIKLGLYISVKGQMMGGVKCISPGIIVIGFLSFPALLFIIFSQFSTFKRIDK